MFVNEWYFSFFSFLSVICSKMNGILVFLLIGMYGMHEK